MGQLAEHNNDPVERDDASTTDDSTDNQAGREERASLLPDCLFDECLFFLQDTNDDGAMLLRAGLSTEISRDVVCCVYFSLEMLFWA